jgi:hypothetical protein
MHLPWKYLTICQWIIDLGNLVEMYSFLAPLHLSVFHCEKDVFLALFLSTYKLAHVLAPLPHRISSYEDAATKLTPMDGIEGIQNVFLFVFFEC